MAVGLAYEVRSAQADALDVLLASGKCKIYDGARPASPNDAVTTQVLLVTINLANPAYGAAANGVLTLQGVPLQGTAGASSTATWARFTKVDDSTVFDCDVAESGDDLIISNANILSGYIVEISSHTYTVPEGG